MNPIESITQAKMLFDQMGEDPQTAFAVLRIAQTVGNDPQKLLAILRIARFLNKNS